MKSTMTSNHSLEKTKKKMRILIVDDSQTWCKILAMAIDDENDMRSEGWLLNTEGLEEEIQRTGAEIVILDYIMPGSNSLETIHQLQNKFRKVQFILCSSYDSEMILEQAMNAGAAGILQKNSDLEVIIEGIRRISRGESAYSNG